MRKILALLLLVPLASCALNSTPARTAVHDAPLTAGIFPLGGQISFNISRPAYVAIFEVVPGRGVGLMYPSVAIQDRQLTAGFHQPFFGLSDFRWGYLPALPVYNLVEGPRILYMVASERPLDLDRLIQYPTALRSELGLARFASHQPFSTIDDLDAMLLGGLPPTQYATDYYVIWPERQYRSVAGLDRSVFVVCRSGRSVTVPVRYAYLACLDGDLQSRPRIAVSEPGAKQPPEVQKPVAARPDRPELGDEGSEVRRERPSTPRETGRGREVSTRGERGATESERSEPSSPSEPSSRDYDPPSAPEPRSTPSPSTGREIRSSGTQNQPATPQ